MTDPEFAWERVVNVLRNVHLQTGKSLRQMAREMGLSHPTVSKIIEGEEGYAPYPKNRVRVAQWILDQGLNGSASLTARQLEMLRELTNVVGAAPTSPDEEVVGAAAVMDPNLMRRAVGAVKPEHVKTRLAIVREFEDIYLEHGYGPDQWPEWFRELRAEIIEAAAAARGRGEEGEG